MLSEGLSEIAAALRSCSRLWGMATSKLRTLQPDVGLGVVVKAHRAPKAS